jgi:hypothetical protein
MKTKMIGYALIAFLLGTVFSCADMGKAPGGSEAGTDEMPQSAAPAAR